LAAIFALLRGAIALPLTGALSSPRELLLLSRDIGARRHRSLHFLRLLIRLDGARSPARSELPRLKLVLSSRAHRAAALHLTASFPITVTLCRAKCRITRLLAPWRVEYFYLLLCARWNVINSSLAAAGKWCVKSQSHWWPPVLVSKW